jgi:hypothetical protein
MYYRVATQVGNEFTWRWKSTVLSSLDTLFRFLRLYGALSQECLWVFSSPSREGLQEQIGQEHQALSSHAVTAVQFLQERLIHPPEGMRGRAESKAETNLEMVPIAMRTQQAFKERGRGGDVLERRGMSALERAREDLESGTGGDHDLFYLFSLPLSTQQVLTWVKLQARVRNGELHP